MDQLSKETVDIAGKSLRRLAVDITRVNDLLFRSGEENNIRDLQAIGDNCVDISSFGFQQSNTDWAFSRPFLLLALLLYAFVIPFDTQTYLEHTDIPSWTYLKLEYFRRAEVLTAGGYTPPIHLHWTWFTEFPSRWPQANKLPRRILRQLGCHVANITLASMMYEGDERQNVPNCRDDLAVFNVNRYLRSYRKHVKKYRNVTRHASSAFLFTSLRPMLRVKPVHLGQAQDYELMASILERYVRDPHGLFLEFGVFKGASLNLTARWLQSLGGGRVYGFDSFKGLPTTFRGGAGRFDGMDDLPPGYFGLENLPPVHENAELVVGYFNETLPEFLKGRLPGNGNPAPEPLRLLHLDCDLADSTREVLKALAPLLRKGCIVVIDDFVNYRGFLEGTLQGLQQFLASGLGPGRLEVLAAPWFIDGEPAKQRTNLLYSNDPSDVERAVAFRIL